MKADLNSNRSYYPMCLSSGRDAVLIDYTGSNFVSLNGHTHLEPHQCASPGWYKNSDIKKGEVIQPIVMAGVQLVMFGAPAEPTDFTQEFFPEKATLVTTLTFRYGIKMRITSFFTYSDSIWCEKIEILESDDRFAANLAFRLNAPITGSKLSRFPRDAKAVFSKLGNDAFYFEYDNKSYKGHGSFFASLPFDRYNTAEETAKNSFIEGFYDNVKKGFAVSRTMIAVGENEDVDEVALTERARLGFDAVLPSHEAEWSEYFTTSQVTMPNEELTYIYNLSRYVVRSYQHPFGLFALGMQPNHWGGGASCSWDSMFPAEAALKCGNSELVEKYLNAYLKMAPECYRAVKALGFDGLSFSGWTTLNGEFFGGRELGEWIVNFKPMFSAFFIHTIYAAYMLAPEIDIEKYRGIVTDVIKFWMSRLIEKAPDGSYRLRSIKDGAETGCQVEIDTQTQLDYAKACQYAGRIFGIAEYEKVGDSMISALEINRRPDGKLAAFLGSPFPTCAVLNYYYAYEDKLYSPDVLRASVECMKTPFGLENEVAAEEYRHWPWNDMFAARAYVLTGDCGLAAEHILHMSYGASSLGALPEKIRLDGFAINYWYSSTHSLFISAAADGFATLAGDTLRLCFGYGKSSGVCCKNIRVPRGLSVSFKTSGDKISAIEIQNLSDKTVEFKIKVNPEFSSAADGAAIKLCAKEKILIN